MSTKSIPVFMIAVIIIGPVLVSGAGISSVGYDSVQAVSGPETDRSWAPMDADHASKREFMNRVGRALGEVILNMEELNSRRILDHQAGVIPPVDATSLIREVLLNEEDKADNDPPVPTRTDPPPSSWSLERSTDNSRIYVAEGESVPGSKLDLLAGTFEDRIYPNSTTWFHPDSPPSPIEIRIYDIGDGAGGIGGFFIGSPFTRYDLYVDTQDLMYSDIWAHEIVAHEFQHLLHWDLDPDEDVWLNEGLADLSARIALGPGTPGIGSHIGMFEDYPENDLLLWEEGEPPDYLETIADYGRAYAYVAYMADHFGGAETISDLVADPLNSVDSIDRTLREKGYDRDHLDILHAEKVSDMVDDPLYGGGTFNQGLIDISIDNPAGVTSDYPFSHTVGSTKSYVGYYYRFTGGSQSLGMLFNGDSSFHVALIGSDGGSVVWSDNVTGDGSGLLAVQLSGFGSLYSELFIIPSTTVRGASYDIEVKEVELSTPSTEVSIDPQLPGGDNGWYLQPPALTLSTREGASVMYYFNDDDPSEVPGTIYPPEGENTLHFYSEGPPGIREEERELEFKVDTTEPVTYFEVDPPEPDGVGGVYITAPTISLEPAFNGDIIEFDLGDGATEYTEPIVLETGTWELSFWSRDPAGRYEEERSLEFVVDLEDPVTQLLLDPPEPDGDGGYYITPPEVSFTLADGDEVRYSLNDEGPSEYEGPFTLDEGIWNMTYCAVSESGRECPTERITIKVDTTPPSLELDVYPTLGSGWLSETVTMTAWSDEEDADILFTFGSDGPFQYNGPITLRDGDYSVDVWVMDSAGNGFYHPSLDVRIDTVSPSTVIRFDRDPESGIWFYDDLPLIDIRAQSEVTSPETDYISVDDGDFTPFDQGDLDLEPGIHTLRYYTTDEAGNRGPTRSKEIGYDASLPVVDVKANRTLMPGPGKVRFDLGDSHDDNGISSYRIDFGDGNTTEWIFEDTIIHNYSELGAYRVSVEVRDVSGRISETDSSVLIEVLTPEEYEKRMRGEGDGTSPILLFILVITLVLLAVGIASLVLLFIRKNRISSGKGEVVEWEEV